MNQIFNFLGWIASCGTVIAAAITQCQDQRLQEVLDETQRILKELGVSSSDEMEVKQPKALASLGLDSER